MHTTLQVTPHAQGIKFGTDGWRAVMCEDFTFKNVKVVVQAIAAHINRVGTGGKGVVVGYDARFMAGRFAGEAAKVVAGNGIPVYVTERDTPTPVVAYAVYHNNRAGAVMFTASHNPPEYNGVKWIPEYAGPAMPEITNEIEKEISCVQGPGEVKEVDLSVAGDQGLIKYFDPRPSYLTHLRSLIDIDAIGKAGLSIVYDPMHGSGREYLDTILADAGCRVTVIRGNRDPLFGGTSPEPTEERLAPLVAAIREGRGSIGLATDGDADRFGVIDSDGTYIPANQVISLVLAHMIKVRNAVEARSARGAVARTVATTHMVDAIAHAYGLRVYETPVGFKYICQKMREDRIIVGGEESGGLSIGGHVPEKDGILAGCLVAEIKAKAGGKSLRAVLDELAAEVGHFYSKRVDIHVPRDAGKDVMESLKESPPPEVAGIPVIGVLIVDGFKALLEDGSWFLVRASGTEPLIRVYAEAGTRDRLNSLLESVQRTVVTPRLRGV